MHSMHSKPHIINVILLSYIINLHFSCQGDFPSVEDMTVTERALHNMRALVRIKQEEVAKAEEKKKKDEEEEEEKKKQAELRAQQEAQKKAAETAKEKAKRTGTTSGG